MEIGEKLRELRIQRGLTQEEMADRCELSKGFISQVERELASPSIATLKDMLACLGVTLQSFFSDDSNEKIVFSPQDMFEKEDPERGLKITWLVPDAQKNSMEPILLELQPGANSQVLPPLESEEFGYVLRGQVTLVVGKKRLTLRKGDSFCLHPAATHQIENNDSRPASVLWVSTPPSF
ncbi:MAG: XRE family transcriptional regulator [Clostridia bacterium]|nr:XRE family transcriptional regulator [Clostridia bacterium]MDD6042045.1 XRE family transcriptional regulator [Clostridia bacterium]